MHRAIYKLFFARRISVKFRNAYLVSVYGLFRPTFKVSRLSIALNLGLEFRTLKFYWRFKRIDSNYPSSFNQRRLRDEKFFVFLWGVKSHLLWGFILESLVVRVRAGQKLDFSELDFIISV